MPKFESRTRYLPPARLTRVEFKAIEEALGSELSSSAKWDFWSGHTNISNENLDELLHEVTDIRGISDFEFTAEVPDASITLTAGSDGCILEYEASHALFAQITSKARALEGIFRENRRRSAMIPRPIASLPLAKRLCLSPAFKIGPPGFQLRIDWNVVIQNVVTNWLSHFGTAVLSFALGVGFGWLLRAIS